MKNLTIILSAFLLFAIYASAHPLVIIKTSITELHVRIREPTALPVYALQRRQGILDQINSFLGVGPTSTKASKPTPSAKNGPAAQTTAATRSLLPPAIATATSTDSTDDSDSSSSTNSDSSTSTSDSSSTSLTSSSAPSSTLPPSTSATPTPSTTLSQTQPTNSPVASNNGGSALPPGGLAATVILVLLVVLVTAWLVFKYHPKSRAWWAARQEKRFRDRSYRDALDGSGKDAVNLRQQALGVSRRQTMKSFFAPATVKLGNDQEIRRKPVNWGATTPPMPSPPEKLVPIGHGDTEKICMTADAAPMGQIERYSFVTPSRSPPTTHCELPAHSAPPAVVSPASMWQKDELEKLPPVSPISLSRGGSVTQTADQALPQLPPVPQLPGLIHAKRGSDGVFRLK